MAKNSPLLKLGWRMVNEKGLAFRRGLDFIELNRLFSLNARCRQRVKIRRRRSWACGGGGGVGDPNRRWKNEGPLLPPPPKLSLKATPCGMSPFGLE
jgi:hypothetical protein